MTINSYRSSPTFFAPSSPDCRHHQWAAGVHFRPSVLHGGAVRRQQTLSDVHAQLPPAIGQRDQPAVLHLHGPLQWGSGQRQRQHRGPHRRPHPGPPVCRPHHFPRRGDHAQPLLARLGRQHPDGQRGLQVQPLPWASLGWSCCLWRRLTSDSGH